MLQIIFLILVFSCNTMAQEIKTSDILDERSAYFYLTELLEKEHHELSLSKEIAFEYTFAIIELIDKEKGEVYLSARISTHFDILEVWCADKNKQKESERFIRNFINQHLTDKKEGGIRHQSKWLDLCESEKVKNKLAIADKIAQTGHYCTSGDDYSPGFYNRILITEAGIELSQENRWNATSLDRENYCLRKLLFFIPFGVLKEEDILTFRKNADGEATDKVDDLLIFFEDHSSPNYKECGQKIFAAIKEEVGKK